MHGLANNSFLPGARRLERDVSPAPKSGPGSAPCTLRALAFFSQERIVEIKRAGTQASNVGNASWFTGSVRIDPLVQAPAPARVAAAQVTFEPGARTAWHTHPLGQTLIVTSGCGRAQRQGGPVEEIRPGDVVWFAPGEKHWHGAAPTTAMSHIAMQESLNGSPVTWMEHVSDEEYLARAAAP